MRDLAFDEMNHVSAGNSAIVGACIAGVILVGLVGSYFSSSYHVKYEPYIHTYEVITPVYDPNGKHVGDMVDKYEETKYKAVYY